MMKRLMDVAQNEVRGIVSEMSQADGTLRDTVLVHKPVPMAARSNA